MQHNPKTTEEIMFTMARSIERIENALLPTPLNGNKGLVAQVFEIEKRVDDLETYRIKKDEIEVEKEARRKKRNEILTVAATIVGVIFAGLTIYLSLKK